MDIAIISLLLGLIFLYLLKRHADRLEETDRRIVDLLVVGYVMGSSGIISGSTNRGTYNCRWHHFHLRLFPSSLQELQTRF